MSFVLSVEPSPDTTPDVPVKEVIQTSLDIASVLLACAIGAVAFFLAAQIIGFILRRIGKHHRFWKYLERRSRVSGTFAVLVIGAAFGWYWSMHKSNWSGYATVSHIILIVCILGVTWWAMSLCGILEDMTKNHQDSSTPNRLVTQAQVLYRVSQVFFAVSGIIAVALTFPQARAAFASILASAGIISLIAGIAAQGVLANMFAGLQIAFSDPIRVGDVVHVEGGQGTIEEITLTYVVMRLWDDRRIILPSKKFTEEPFENWTKRDTKLLGDIELYTDWRLPMAALRNELDALLTETELWDGRTANAQVIDTSGDTMLIRVVVSASNAGDLWDLKCFLREHLLDWIQRKTPYALPRLRIEPQEIAKVKMSTDQIEVERQIRASAVARARQENAIRREDATGNDSGIPTTDPYGEPLLDQYAKKLQDRRRSWREKVRNLAKESEIADETVAETRQLNATSTISVERMYSGSPDADERRKLVSGPARDTDKDTSNDTDGDTSEKVKNDEK